MNKFILTKMNLNTDWLESCSQIFGHGKRSLYIILSCLSLSFFQVAAQVSPQYSLTIEISGIKDNKGVIMLQLLNASQEVVTQEKGVIENGKSIMTFKNLAPGKYAVRYFQDENLNGELDKNKLGIPTEGYGFSNDAYGMFGPKPFRDWLFELDKDKKLVLKIKY